MRVLLTTSNWAGHFFCMVPLGWALQAAGHEVRVACTPAKAETVARTGLLPAPVLDGLDMMYAARMMCYAEALEGRRTSAGFPLHPYTDEPVTSLDDFDFQEAAPRFFEEMMAATRRSFDGAAEFARAWRPSLVIYDVLGEEGALAAAVAGVPAAMFCFGLVGSVETDPALHMGTGDVTKSFPRHHLEAWTRHQVEYVIDPSPDGITLPFGSALRIPIRYIPYNGPGAVPRWTLRRSERPRVAVIWTNSATGMFGPEAPALRTAIEAAVEAGAEVTFTANPRQVAAMGALPEEVRVLSDFPLHLMLSPGDILVHNGGANGLLTAAVSAAPQLALPPGEDTRVHSERLARTGSLLVLPGPKQTAEAVREAVETLLTEDRYRVAARRLRDDLMRHPTPAQLVPSLERLARTGRLTTKDLPGIQ